MFNFILFGEDKGTKYYLAFYFMHALFAFSIVRKPNGKMDYGLALFFMDLTKKFKRIPFIHREGR